MNNSGTQKLLLSSLICSYWATIDPSRILYKDCEVQLYDPLGGLQTDPGYRLRFALFNLLSVAVAAAVGAVTVYVVAHVMAPGLHSVCLKYLPAGLQVQLLLVRADYNVLHRRLPFLSLPRLQLSRSQCALATRMLCIQYICFCNFACFALLSKLI